MLDTSPIAPGVEVRQRSVPDATSSASSVLVPRWNTSTELPSNAISTLPDGSTIARDQPRRPPGVIAVTRPHPATSSDPSTCRSASTPRRHGSTVVNTRPSPASTRTRRGDAHATPSPTRATAIARTRGPESRPRKPAASSRADDPERPSIAPSTTRSTDSTVEESSGWIEGGDPVDAVASAGSKEPSIRSSLVVRALDQCHPARAPTMTTSIASTRIERVRGGGDGGRTSTTGTDGDVSGGVMSDETLMPRWFPYLHRVGVSVSA